MSRVVLLSLLAILAATPACTQQPAAPPPPPLSADAVQQLRDERLPPSATQGDVALLDQAFRALHPAVYRYNTPEAWARRVDSLRQWFAEPRSRGETYLAFAHLTASLQCSHTYMSFWNQPGPVHRWLTDGADKLPFEYALTPADGWVVTRSSSAVLPGDTIVAVNDVPTERIIARLLPYVRGDGEDDGKRRALLDFRHRKKHEAIDVFLPLILPPRDGQYTVTLRRDGRDSTLRVASMAAADRRAHALPVPPERPRHELTREGDIAILRVDGFDYGDDEDKWAPFVKNTFQSLQRDSVRTLVLDLRENEGGSDEGALLLLQHLIRTPITMPPLRRYVAYDTVPAALRPHLRTWDNAFYDRRGKVIPRGDGTFDLKEGAQWPTSIPVARNAFTGRVIVLTSYVNSSASHIMLRLLARRPGITLVGDPTGGSLRASTGGNLFFMSLPGTGMEVDVPLIAYDWGMSNPAGGVQPDIAVPAREAMATALAVARAP
jgi:C-terminal processing protease CtpA/Prc